MGKFVIKEPNGNVQWVKAIDTANGTIEFTNKESEAYRRDGDYYSKAEGEFIKFNFIKEHPQLQYLKVDLGYGEMYTP